MDGSYPGSGDFDFGSILRVLQEAQFQGYVSAEVFDYSPGATFIAKYLAENGSSPRSRGRTMASCDRSIARNRPEMGLCELQDRF